jgi:hypothetical protein
MLVEGDQNLLKRHTTPLLQGEIIVKLLKFIFRTRKPISMKLKAIIIHGRWEFNFCKIFK